MIKIKTVIPTTTVEFSSLEIGDGFIFPETFYGVNTSNKIWFKVSDNTCESLDGLIKGIKNVPLTDDIGLIDDETRVIKVTGFTVTDLKHD